MHLLSAIELISFFVVHRLKWTFEQKEDDFCEITFHSDRTQRDHTYRFKDSQKIKILLDASGSVEEFIEAIKKVYTKGTTVFNLQSIMRCPTSICIPYFRFALESKAISSTIGIGRDLVFFFKCDCVKLQQAFSVLLELENVPLDRLYRLAMKQNFVETAKVIKSFEIPNSKGVNV